MESSSSSSSRRLKSIFNRITLFSTSIATLTLLLLYLFPPPSCHHHASPPPQPRFPTHSCEANRREFVPPEKRTHKLLSTNDARKRISALRSFLHPLRDLRLLSNSSRVLCVSAGAGHEVAALAAMGVADVTGVDVIDSPPLVSRADPHNLPFFDGVFDLGFSAHLAEALFPRRFAAEMERTVRRGGAIVLAIEGWWAMSELRQIMGLFRRSDFVEARNVTLIGSRVSFIILRNGYSL